MPFSGLPAALRTAGGSMPWATAFRIIWINGSASRWTTPASTSVLSPEKTTSTSLPTVRAISRTAF